MTINELKYPDIPRFYEGRELPEHYFDEPPFYYDGENLPRYNVFAAIAYAEDFGKTVRELTYEELSLFELDENWQLKNPVPYVERWIREHPESAMGAGNTENVADATSNQNEDSSTAE